MTKRAMTKKKATKKGKKSGPHKPDPNTIAHGMISTIIARSEGREVSPNRAAKNS